MPAQAVSTTTMPQQERQGKLTRSCVHSHGTKAQHAGAMIWAMQALSSLAKAGSHACQWIDWPVGSLFPSHTLRLLFVTSPSSLLCAAGTHLQAMVEQQLLQQQIQRETGKVR